MNPEIHNPGLLREGYPPIAVRPADRKTYLDSLEHASMRKNLKPFLTLMHERLNATPEEHLSALQEAKPPGTEARSTGDLAIRRRDRLIVSNGCVWIMLVKSDPQAPTQFRISFHLHGGKT